MIPSTPASRPAGNALTAQYHQWPGPLALGPESSRTVQVDLPNFIIPCCIVDGDFKRSLV